MSTTTSARPSTSVPVSTTTTTTTITTTTTTPTTTTLPSWVIDATTTGVLRRPTVLGGAFRFQPPDGERPKRRRVDAALLARRTVPKTVWQRSGATDVFFAVFEVRGSLAAAPEDPGASPVRGRSVWVVRYRSVTSARAVPITIPSRHGGSTTSAPSTTEPAARVDIVVILDDASGDQLIRSEYASEVPS